MATWSVLVIGHVQGVGFRSFVVDLAARMGISGEVWNRLDGNVEALAMHDSHEELQLFVESLKLGPGRVDRVHTAEFVDAPECMGFRASYTR